MTSATERPDHPRLLSSRSGPGATAHASVVVAARPAARRARHLVITAALMVVVIGGQLWRGAGPGGDPAGDHPAPAPVPVPPPSAPSPPPAPSSSTAVPPSASGMRPYEPIPPGGITPITPPTAMIDPALDPTAVAALVVPAPAGDPTAAELATPAGAATAWLARRCPFDHHDPAGAAEHRARAAMTDRGWALFDPAGDPAATRSWQRTVAAAETGRCTPPTATVAVAAPRGDTGVVVHVSALRLITGPAAPAYVERLDHTRLVLRGADGLWHVDLETEGG